MAASHEPIALRSWPALLVAPLLALGMQSIAYALVTPSCAHAGGSALLHLVSAAALVLSVVLTAVAATGWRRARDEKARAVPAVAEPVEGGRDLFLGRVATLTGAFSALTIAAMWIPVWLLPPCL
jgi:hypothetical protein